MNLGAGEEISIRDLAELVAERDRLRGRDRLGHDEAERPAAAAARRDAGARALRLRGAHAACARARAHRRLVPRGASPVSVAQRARARPRSAAGERSIACSSASRRARPLIVVQIAATIVLALVGRPQRLGLLPGRRPDLVLDDGWLLGQLELPPTELGYRWSFLLTPITWITGPTFVAGAARRSSLLQVLVLGPIALLLRLRASRSRIGGRLLGYWASLPLGARAVRGDPALRRPLPRALGRAVPAAGARADGDGGLPVDGARARLRGSSSSARSTHGRLPDAVARGTPPRRGRGRQAAEPAHGRRRRRSRTSSRAAGERASPSARRSSRRSSSSRSGRSEGSGASPRSRLEEARLAVGARRRLSVDLDRYLELDFDHWRNQMDQLREFFWSARVAQWAPIAGLIAVIRVRRGAIAALLAGWLAAFLRREGLLATGDIEADTFWRLLMPAWPAYLLLSPRSRCSCRRSRGGSESACAHPRRRPVARRWIVVVAVLTVLVPAAAIAVSSPLEDRRSALTQDDAGNVILTPVDESVDLAWSAPPERTTGSRGPTGRGARTSSTASTAPTARTSTARHTDGHPAESLLLLRHAARDRRDDARVPRRPAPRRTRPTGSVSARTGSTTRRGRRLRVQSRPAVRGRLSCLLEQRDPLREIDVLVREPRDHRRVVEEDEEDEERRDREEHRRRIARRRRTSPRSCSGRRARPRARAARRRSRARAARSAP